MKEPACRPPALATATDKDADALTATVTATAAPIGYRQRTATAHNTRAIRANRGYARPEKQTVEDQRCSAATVAKPLNSTRCTWTTLEYRPSLRPLTDGPGRCAHSYGSASGACRAPRHFDTPALISRPTTTSTITPISAFVPIFPTSLAISSPKKYESPT